MCDPISLSVATLAITAGSAVADHVGQAKNKKANDKAADSAFYQTVGDLNVRERQEQDASQLTIMQASREARANKAMALVSAGEAGVSGASVDALLGDVDRQAAEFNQTQKKNLDMTTEQLERDKLSGNAQMLSQKASVAGPNLFATGLRIGGAALEAGSSIYNYKHPKAGGS